MELFCHQMILFGYSYGDMIPNIPMARNVPSDAELVNRTLEGDREAFEQIVSRYQSLVCSLAYSATGSLGQSQDLAQETFITAWKHLRLLRERAKLRAWLCGIVRRLIGKTLRRQGHEPTHAAEPLDSAVDSLAVEAPPVEALISKEEEAVLWRAVERIPANYREALILFYRERQSVEKVAVALDLSEDAVKQRLSRGRKLLHQEVLTFVEGAITRTSPNQSFTLGVMAVLPVISSSAVTAGLGATIAKSGSAAKVLAWLTGLNVLAGPLTGFTASYVGYKLSLQSATSDRERSLIRRFYAVVAVFVVFPFALVLLAICARPLQASHPRIFTGLLICFGMLWVPGIVLLLLWARQKLRSLPGAPLRSDADTTSGPAPLWEYRSRASLFGIPLVHIASAQRGPAFIT